MPDEQERRQIWELTERNRNGYIVFARNMAMNGLNKQAQPIFDASESAQIRRLEGLLETLSESAMMQANVTIYTAVAKNFAKSVFNSLKFEATGMSQKQEFPEIQFEEEIKKYLENEGGKLITAETETTKKQISKILQQAVEDGVSQADLQGYIKKKIKPLFRYRAEFIGRTETIRASNWGSLQGANNATIQTRKEWISTFDSRTRGSPLDAEPDIYDHWSMDGQIRDRSNPFREPRTGETLLYPVDPSASPGNTINCRCTLAFVPV